MFKIKKEITCLLQWISPLINDKNLINGRSKPVFLPFYHHVSNEGCDYIRPLYSYKNTKQFEKELDYFLRHFTAVDANFLLSNSKTSGKPLVHLSFDDGLKSCSEIIAPILLAKGIPASFFVSPDFATGKAVFYRFKIAKLISAMAKNLIGGSKKVELKNQLKKNNKWLSSIKHSLMQLNHSDGKLINQLLESVQLELKANDVYMNENEIQSLAKSGFNIGAHSMNHPEFSKISLREQQRQCEESINWVMNKFNPSIRLFSFPFTDAGVDNEFYEWLFDKSNLQVDAAFGTAGLKFGVHQRLFQRVPMELYPNTIERRVKAEYMYYNLLSLANKNKRGA